MQVSGGWARRVRQARASVGLHPLRRWFLKPPNMKDYNIYYNRSWRAGVPAAPPGDRLVREMANALPQLSCTGDIYNL